MHCKFDKKNLALHFISTYIIFHQLAPFIKNSCDAFALTLLLFEHSIKIVITKSMYIIQ
uniref:RE63886p n=1 Tax=Drosophila melanogaster TaxID=7227 RepID=B5X545_DROME|nr:RE63886p [Drosophila melanogaster]